MIYCNLYRSPNIVKVIKSRILRWAGHVAKMEEDRSAFRVLTGKSTRNVRLKNVNGTTNIRINLMEIGVKVRN